MKTKYFEELKPKLIYVFRINDGTHKGCLKLVKLLWVLTRTRWTSQPSCQTARY